MPELPEVETIRRGLSGFLAGQVIRKVEVLCEKSFIGPTEVVVGAEIREIGRRGKCLLIELGNGVTIMIHLRMTGQLIYREFGCEEREELLAEKSFAGGHPSESFVEELPNKQTRVVVELDKGTLYFNDQRKFGFLKPVPTEEVGEDAFIKKLAPEPWEMDPEEFYRKLMRHKGAPVKAVILDQTVVAGIGNIYADEALFKSRIHPERRAGSLSREEAELLLKSAGEVMTKSIESGGSTMATYVKADGTRGNYLDLFAEVFRREGELCRRCGTEIVKLRVAGRGTHICPSCQVLGDDETRGDGAGGAA